MRLLTYEKNGERRVGLRVDGGVAPTRHTEMLELIRSDERPVAVGPPVDPDRVLAPLLNPGKILGSGINFRSHLDENPTGVLPEEPFFFSKLASSIIGPGEPIVIPSPTSQVDYEVELAVVVGRAAKRVPLDEAMDHVFGYTVLHDVTARDVQFKDAQITLGKNFDTFCPLGPEIVTADELRDPTALHLATYLNGETMQSAPTDNMLFSVAEYLAYLSNIMTLHPGDIFTMGTPAGVGTFRSPQVWLRPSDEVTVEIDAIGLLTNPVVAGW